MNQYLLALIGVIGALAVGYLFYGLLFKDVMKVEKAEFVPSTVAISLVAMYLSVLAFIMLYNDVTFNDSTAGAMKGLQLGLMAGIGLFGLPLFADRGWLNTSSQRVWVVLVNWVVTFAVVGLIVGALA
jgi:hypothetical protein